MIVFIIDNMAPSKTEVKHSWKVFISKVGDLSRGWPEGSLFNSYYTEVKRRALLLSLDCSTLPLILIKYTNAYTHTHTHTNTNQQTQTHNHTNTHTHTHREKHTNVLMHTHTHTNQHTQTSKSKVVSLSRGWPEGSLFNSYYTRCRGEHNSFPWIASLSRWSLSYIAECKARRHQVPFFESLVWLNLRLNPGLPGHWRTL